MAREYKCMVFKLSDGSEQTARDVVAKYGVPLGTTRTRLSNGIRDIDILSKPPMSHKRNRCKDPSGAITQTKYVPEKTVKERRAERNANCPWSRMFLKMV
jgi:hypothetical protein